jgi:hypothetical protein
VAGPFQIESKPYAITSKALLAATDDVTSMPAAEPAVAEVTPGTLKAEPASESAHVGESPATDSKSGSWKIISVLIGLGIVAAGFAIYKKTAV